MELQLTNQEFKVLSSTTRTKIMKLLQERNHTATELSQKIGLSTPTIKEHLKVLETARFIEIIDEGRKWKYYKLTTKAKQLLNKKEQQNNILIVLSTATLLSVLAIALIFTNYDTQKEKTELTPSKTETNIQSKAMIVKETPKCTTDENFYKETQEKAIEECEKIKTKEECEKQKEPKCAWK